MCGCSIHIVPGGGFNIHRLLQHDPQASDCCSRESSKVENHSIFHGFMDSWIDFSGEQINDGEADQNQWNACREEGVERHLVDSDQCFNHGRLLGLI